MTWRSKDTKRIGRKIAGRNFKPTERKHTERKIRANRRKIGRDLSC